MEIILSVAPHSNGYYNLGVNAKDRSQFHGQLICILGSRPAFAMDLSQALQNGVITHPIISQWIADNQYHKYPLRKPTKLRFNLDGVKLTFVEKI